MIPKNRLSSGTPSFYIVASAAAVPLPVGHLRLARGCGSPHCRSRITLHKRQGPVIHWDETSCRRNAAGLKRLGNGDIGMLNLIAPDRPVAESPQLARVMGFPYYGWIMNLTLSIDDELIKKVRKIAVERDTTLTGMVRDYLEQLAADDAASGRRRREREALERSFEGFRFKVGKRTWKRADLYARS